MSGKLNLDQLCAEYGYQMAKQVHDALKKQAENHLTKSLGVLQEDGVYAFFLYQASRGEREKKGAIELSRLAGELLSGVPIAPFDTRPALNALEAVRGDAAKKIRGLADDLDNLLLAKRLLEQALIYARYHAKALGD